MLSILSRGGVEKFSAAPKDTSALTAEILALPRVSFCTIRADGGVVTVTVEVSGEGVPLEEGALYAPATGTLEELLVIRGTPLFSVGDSVTEGTALVGDYAVYGDETRTVLVIARATVSFPVQVEYGMGEAWALSQAYLDYGELADLHTEKTENGTLVSGIARKKVAVNLG